MGEFISTAFHLLYETVRQFWWAFFLGWWVFWGVKAHRAKSWAALKVPSIITAIGLVVALASTMQVYEAVNDPGNFSVQLDP